MVNDLDASRGDSGKAADYAFRRYLVVRISSWVSVVLMLASVVLIFVLKNSPAGFFGSIAALAVFFVAFQLLHRKRRSWFKRWVALKGDSGA
jgi:multisubunit Na+/H+ antiporter MnhB subunit